MKAVILAGGYGTRLSEETGTIPKPLVEIGNRPILWHIMKIYEASGITEFVVCCGYKGHMIKRYFTEYALTNADLTVDLSQNSITLNRRVSEPWKVTLVDTGQDTMTGGRLKRVGPYLGGETFCMTYGDGVANIDIRAAIAFHREQGTEATVTAVQQPGRFGALNLAPSGNRVSSFREKSILDGPVINGGFFVLEPAVLDRIAGDDTVFEEDPLRSLVQDDQLSVYRHDGFWQNMDTLRDKHVLQDLWQTGTAPWRLWA